MAEYYETGRHGHGGNDGEDHGSSSKKTSQQGGAGDQEYSHKQQERMAAIIQKGLSLVYEGHKAKEQYAPAPGCRSRSTASYYYYGNLFD
ncbi:hypothetical protein OsI_05323 [Oryza sativa Indica Group]|uniref:Uncharacterized protein n=4 Tax=Oryza TaxID=4527 RepID=A0A0D3EZ12_9ORYZ|nr:hypothetical protein OsI_05323 [Oryza sativa Indica Group]KAF2954450.1 hypothetical protein DAI22_01g483200 [Oryza sativa Japonica Group]